MNVCFAITIAPQLEEIAALGDTRLTFLLLVLIQPLLAGLLLERFYIFP
jgi:hypothetical protein